MTSRRRDDLRRRWQSLREPFDQAAALSLLVLVPLSVRAGLVQTAVLAVVGAVVVLTPEVRRSPWPWAVFAAFHAYSVVARWYAFDNHDILIFYWTLALVVATVGRRREQVLASEARLMLGTVFTLAAGWKLASSTFRSGEFFSVTLATDPRFGRAVSLFTDVSSADVAANREAMNQAKTAIDAGVVPLTGVADIAPLAMALTIATVVVELGVAVLMLLPQRPERELPRSIALAVFLVGTYLIVPVVRFGIILLTMGVAQAVHRPRIRMAFLVGAVALAVWANIWVARVLVLE